jgi:ubiquinone/menaquinone biosynthesis C-methylase UbiE
MSDLRSNAEWRQWGKNDPLFGVASWKDKEKGGASPWTEDDFYSLGESDWRDFWEHWKHYGVDTRSCIEIGCGAGRMTKQLAKAFDHVYAVDVSEDMIRVARRSVGATVEFSVIDGTHLPQPDCSVSALFSTHVIQHLDSVEIGYSYFREFFRVLDAGGTLMVHLPLYTFPSGPFKPAMHILHSCARQLSNLRAEMKRRLGMPTMRGTPYSTEALYAFLAGLGFRNVEFRIFPTKSNNDLHPFVFATK